MARNKHKQGSKLRKILSFIFCSSCLTGNEADEPVGYDRHSDNDSSSEDESGNDDGSTSGDDRGGDDDRDSERSSVYYRGFGHDNSSDYDTERDGDRRNEDSRSGNNVRDTVGVNKHSLQDEDDIIDIDDQEIVVTRVYVSASAHNIVKHHANFFPRSDSDIDVKNFVRKKVDERPKKKSRNDSEWAIPSTDREVRIDRWMDIFSEIGIHPDAENDMLADGELVLEEEQNNHFTAENGDMGNWDLYIA